MVVLFQPIGVTYFNSVFNSTILNVVFSGFLAFLIVLELENIAAVLMYRTHTINKRSIDEYILFSRVSSMRGMKQTLSGLEYPATEISTRPPCYGQRWTGRFKKSARAGDDVDDSDHDTTVVTADVDTERSLSVTDLNELQLPDSPEKRCRIAITVRDGVPYPRVNLIRVLMAIFVRLALLTLELGAIYSSSNISENVQADRSFNVRLAEGNAAFNTSQPDNFQCREFITSARGVEQNGSVLLCIGSEETLEFIRLDYTTVHFRFDPTQNRMEYMVESDNGQSISVYVRVLINLIGSDSLELAPLRPDVQVGGNYSKKMAQMVMNRAMYKLGFDVKNEQIEESVDEKNVIRYRYRRHFGDTSAQKVATALISELRQLTLDLNVTQEGEEDAVYVFSKDRGYFRHENPVIAIVSKNRVAHVWLIIAWVSILLVRVVAQRFFVSFDELAYLALKRVHGADMSVGPLANVEEKDAVRISKFSDGRVGHIGFRAANERQDRVENFYGCEVVLGSGEGARVER